MICKQKKIPWINSSRYVFGGKMSWTSIIRWVWGKKQKEVWCWYHMWWSEKHMPNQRFHSPFFLIFFEFFFFAFPTFLCGPTSLILSHSFNSLFFLFITKLGHIKLFIVPISLSLNQLGVFYFHPHLKKIPYRTAQPSSDQPTSYYNNKSKAKYFFIIINIICCD